MGNIFGFRIGLALALIGLSAIGFVPSIEDIISKVIIFVLAIITGLIGISMIVEPFKKGEN